MWFRQDLTVKGIQDWCENTMVDHLGIEITEIGEDFLKGTMPIDSRTVQPHRRLHGGASCVLAETLGSIAANLVLNQKTHVAFGQSINASHLRPGVNGVAVGIAKPIHLGKSTQVWEIQIKDESEEKLLCLSRLTMAVIRK